MSASVIRLPAVLPGGRRFHPEGASAERAAEPAAKHALGPHPAARPHAGPRVVVIDNYDSFTFNLVQYLLELGATVDVYANDAVEPDLLVADAASHLLLSPGPGRPADAGICPELCRRVCSDWNVPMLGVCLGHQALCEVHGAQVVQAKRIVHGKTSAMRHAGEGILAGLPSPFVATRYHSLVVEPSSLPADLHAIAHTSEGELMAVAVLGRPVYSVQFHPESILSEHGHALLSNFLGLGSAPV